MQTATNSHNPATLLTASRERCGSRIQLPVRLCSWKGCMQLYQGSAPVMSVHLTSVHSTPVRPHPMAFTSTPEQGRPLHRSPHQLGMALLPPRSFSPQFICLPGRGQDGSSGGGEAPAEPSMKAAEGSAVTPWNSTSCSREASPS